jgi:hypothetical protein
MKAGKGLTNFGLKRPAVAHRKAQRFLKPCEGNSIQFFGGFRSLTEKSGPCLETFASQLHMVGTVKKT